MWEQASDQLFKRTRQPAKLLGHEPLDLARRLRVIGFNYFLSLPAEKPPTRGYVVNALEALSNAKSKRQQRLIKTLPIEAVNALFGRFPAPGLKMHDRLEVENEGEIEGDTFCVLAPEWVLPAAWKSRTAHRSVVGGQTSFRVDGGSMGRPVIPPRDLVRAREKLASFALEEADQFRKHLNATIEDLLDALQLRGQSGRGRNVPLNAGVTAGADWRLINKVLDRIWPIEKGPMAPQQITAARTIVEAVKIFALESQGRGVPAKFEVIDWSRGADLMTLRHQIDTLNASIRFVERRKCDLQGVEGYSESNRDRWLRFSNMGFYPLLDSRRELERRLEFGDYRARNETVRRPTGPALPVPAFPRFTKADGLLHRTIVLIRAARSLRQGAMREIPLQAA